MVVIDLVSLLKKHPEYIEGIGSMLSKDNWVNLLEELPQFANKCDKWDEFSRHDWRYLLQGQPQFPNNPAIDIERPLLRQDDPEFYSAADVKKLLNVAPKDSSILLFLVLALYGGFRVTEMLRMRWRHIALYTPASSRLRHYILQVEM